MKVDKEQIQVPIESIEMRPIIDKSLESIFELMDPKDITLEIGPLKSKIERNEKTMTVTISLPTKLTYQHPTLGKEVK